MTPDEYITASERTEARFGNTTVGIPMLNMLKTDARIMNLFWSELKRVLIYGKTTDAEYLHTLATDAKEVRLVSGPSFEMLHMALGMCSESFEFLELVMHCIENDIAIGPEMPDNLRNKFIVELGDGQWYHAGAARKLHTNLERVWEANLAKLRTRFPERFEAFDALNRDETAEADAVAGVAVEPGAKSWKPAVIADNSGKWAYNGLRFATEREAKASADELASRWLLVRDTAAHESDDPVNSAWDFDTDCRIDLKANVAIRMPKRVQF